MALSVGAKVLLDTNIFIDYLRAGMHMHWVLGPVGGRIRFLSSVVLFELSSGADTRKRRVAVESNRAAFPATGGSRLRPARSSGRAVYSGCLGTGAGDRLGRLNDLLIGLTAREIGATVVTRDPRRVRAHRDRGARARGDRAVVRGRSRPIGRTHLLALHDRRAPADRVEPARDIRMTSAVERHLHERIHGDPGRPCRREPT